MAKPTKTTRQTTPKAEAPAVDLDALIRSLRYGDEARRLFPDLPDPDKNRYPATISATAPEDATWRKSFKVWGCHVGDGWREEKKGKDGKVQQLFHPNNPYWPYAWPVHSPGTMLFTGASPSESYVPQSMNGAYTIIDKGGNGVPVHCVFCKKTLWVHGTGPRSELWYCVNHECNEDHGIR